MDIAIIDNDLVVRKSHNFPNLALMKLSGYHKLKGDTVSLVGFDEINPSTLFYTKFDRIYIGKVFTDSETPAFVFKLNNIKIGGTGFYFDKAEPLSYEIEHSFPDYNLYSNVKKLNNKYYNDASIGYTTRGCFRHCEFCVNKNSNKVTLHSNINEFYDKNKGHITLLDDNVLGLNNKNLYALIEELNQTQKKIQWRQGLDIRLISDERAEKLIKMRYDSHYHFAFDRMQDAAIIESKLKIWQTNWDSIHSGTAYYINTRFYVFMGFDRNNNYDKDFWLNEIESVFIRIKILFKYKSIPFVMRYYKWKDCVFYKFLVELTQWTNNARNIAMYSLSEYIELADRKESKRFLTNYPEFKKYFDLKLKTL